MTSTHRFVPTGRLLTAAAIAIAALSNPARAAVQVALRVTLHATAEVGASHVTLGDIATVAGDDAGLVASVSALEVGDVAADGAASVVDRAALVRWVRGRAGVAPQDIAWAGAEHCSVHRVVDTAPLRPASSSADAAGGGVRALVARGGTAMLRSVDGAIEVESRVEVHEDGAAGQDVRVRLPGATADVLARVTGPGRVEVIR